MPTILRHSWLPSNGSNNQPMFDVACDHMANAIAQIARSMPSYGIDCRDISPKTSKFIVSPDIMNHLKTVFRNEIYYPGRNRVDRSADSTPTFMGLPVVCSSILERNMFNLSCELPSGNRVGIQQVIPVMYSPIGMFSGLTIIVKSRAEMPTTFSEHERRALETLREMISESDYRKYLRYGFILVPGQSGKVYQICRNRNHVKVWSKGQNIEEICVGIKDSSIPLTDKVIALKVILESSEEEFRRMGNVYRLKVAA